MKRKQRGQDIKYPLNLMHNRGTDKTNYSKDGGGGVKYNKEKTKTTSAVQYFLCVEEELSGRTVSV